MKSFDELYELAAVRKGGAKALDKLISKPKPAAALKKIADDRWLSMLTKCVFQAGFNWKVVDNKWPGFEEAFEGFNPRYVAGFSDDDLDRLVKDTRVIRQWRKLNAARDNAQMLVELADEHGSAAAFFADYPHTSYIELLAVLKNRGSRLGGTTAQYFLRFMGKDSFILSRDVVAALKREKIIDSAPSSKKALAATQKAFNTWIEQGGESLSRVSRVLAMGIDS